MDAPEGVHDGTGRRYAPGPEWLGRPPDGASGWSAPKPPVRENRRFEGVRSRRLGSGGDLLEVLFLEPMSSTSARRSGTGSGRTGTGRVWIPHRRGRAGLRSLKSSEQSIRPRRCGNQAFPKSATFHRLTSASWCGWGSWHVGGCLGVASFLSGPSKGPVLRSTERFATCRECIHGSYNADGAPEHSRGAPLGVACGPLTCGCRGWRSASGNAPGSCPGGSRAGGGAGRRA